MKQTSKLDKVLFVDDDYVANHLNKALIEGLDLTKEIVIARNGEEALNMIKNMHIRSNRETVLVFLDLNMPVMDGFEFLNELEKEKPLIANNLFVVILTSSTNQKDVERAKCFPIYGYVDKPLTEEKLMPLVSTLIH